MESPPPPTASADPNGHPNARLSEVGALRALVLAVRSRVISGLLLALPIVLTFWILYWLYSTLQAIVVWPMTRLYFSIRHVEAPSWWEHWVAPPIAVILIIALLYTLGLFVRSSTLAAVDWILLRVPVVTTIYRALRNVSRSLASQMQRQQYQRVVLVQFPHPGTRALAFVTNTLQDAATGRTIVCVCVLTGVMPPAGFTLYVPEEDVIDVPWSANECLQAILSGGMTSPAIIHYFNGKHAPGGTGPIIDSHGKPIEPQRDVPENAPA